MVHILLAPGFEEMEALIPADLLRRAGIPVALTSLEGEQVTGGHGITVAADMELAKVNLTQVSMLVLPGGAHGVRNLAAHPAVSSLIQEAVDREIPLAAICAAPTLLGSMGLLLGKQAVCYPGLEEQLTGAQVPEGARVVRDGRLTTGQAAGSAVEFGLALIEQLAGTRKAQEVRHAIHA